MSFREKGRNPYDGRNTDRSADACSIWKYRKEREYDAKKEKWKRDEAESLRVCRTCHTGDRRSDLGKGAAENGELGSCVRGKRGQSIREEYYDGSGEGHGRGGKSLP